MTGCGKMIAWLAACAALLAGCAQEVEDIDRTQPNRVHKSMFEGEWFLARTVIDAPYTTDFTFIGESAELERVRWEIQSDMLIAFRVYDRVDGTDKATMVAPGEFKGAPIVAYPIVSHFDVQREYNAQTGEQSNVIVENTTDRPWYERDYIRVDWSTNLLPSLTFLVDFYAGAGGSYVVETPLSYHVESPDDPHHMVVGVKEEDGTWTDHRTDDAIASLKSANYLETTTRVAVSPKYLELWDDFDQIWRDPACWYYLNADCEHQNILVRTSFLKAPEKSHYEPLHFPDNEIARDGDGKAIRVLRGADGNATKDESGIVVRYPMFDKFGFFRVERHAYDPVYGELEANRTYLATRFDIWDESGEPKPIVYYKSPDWPEFLNDEAQHMADQWNEVFKKAVQVTGKTPPDRMFELRDNSGQRIGDVRYSFLYYVAKPTLAGLLGYGPSNADPLTGEIISATAYVYGAQINVWAGMGRQIVDLLNGRLDPEDLALGKDVQALLHKMKIDLANKDAGLKKSPLTMEQLEDFVETRVNSERGQAIRKNGLHKLKRPASWFQGRMEKIKGTAFEKLLINEEVKLMRGRGLIGPSDPIPEEALSALSPVGWGSKQKREFRRKRRMRMAKKTMLMADFADDAVAGLALDLKSAAPEAVLQTLHEKIFQSTAEHEVGHTLGLRHNFAGSYDALNFPKPFWDLQGPDPVFPPKPRTPAQIAGRMDEYRYSSIMEYSSRFNADIQGLGHYDEAAILFGYAQHVQAFENKPTDPMATAFSDELDLAWVLQEGRHYTSLPSSLGGIQEMFARKWVPYEEVKKQMRGDSTWQYWEVPFRFCSDEYEGATASCAMYDSGMDPIEIVTDAAYRYRNYYFFRAFKRDQAGWEPWGYYDSIWFRYFRHMLNQYQHWAFLSFDRTQLWEDWRFEGANQYGIEDVQWELARDGGASFTAAARAGLNFLVEVLALPRPGGFAYDPDLQVYTRYTSDPNEWPLCGPEAQEKDDPSLPCLDLNVELGDGRYAFTQYDPTDGYYFYERPLFVGAFSDKVLALEMLADPTISFLGVDTSEDVQGYALGFFLYFPDILTRVTGGIIADKVSEFAGSTQYGVYYPPDVFSSPPSAHTTVDPDTWSTVQYYAMWYGMAGYASGFDNTFNDLMHVWYDGSGLGQTLPEAEADSVATWYDPSTQRTYRAIKHPDDKLFSVAHAMVTRAASLQKKIDEPGPGDDPAYAKILLGYQRELLDLSMGMWEMYGKLIF